MHISLGACLLLILLNLQGCRENSKPPGASSKLIENSKGAEIYLLNKKAYHFPLTAFVEYDDSSKPDTFRLAWYSGMLRALKEPALFEDYEDTEVYRFTCLRSFHAPFAIRVEKQQYGGGKLTLKISDGAGGYTSSNLVTNASKVISKAQWESIMLALEKSNFWELPTYQDDSGCDGSRWIFEGVKNGRYHVVDRWTPKKTSDYHALGAMLISLSEARLTPRY
jgi:hypothetical protein